MYLVEHLLSWQSQNTCIAKRGVPLAMPMVGVSVLFIPPYMKKISFTTAYFLLNQWKQSLSGGINQEHIMFLHSSPMSDISPCMQPYPVWMDYAEKNILKKPPESAPLHCFRAFHIHQVLAVTADKPSGGLAPYVYTPCCEGHEPLLEPNIPEVIPEDTSAWASWDIGVTEPSEFHWSLVEDKEFEAHLN